MVTLARAVRQGSKFQNPVATSVGDWRTMLKLIPLYSSNRQETEPRTPLGPFATDARLFETAPETGLRVTWFGHSSILLEVDGVRLMLDPVWDERASPLSFVGPRRFFAPTLALDRLPAVDAVVISHDHYDHLGKETVRRLARMWPDMRWITSLAVGAELQRFGVAAERITELDWTESTQVTGRELGQEVTLTSLPARHFSGRSFSNRFETLWSSFAITGPRHRIYHGVDSGYWEGYAAIGAAYGPFDLIMLEIGAFHPLWASIHLGPDGAVQAFQDLACEHSGSAGLLMPIHWGLFNLALHGWRQPIERMTQLADQQHLPLFSPAPGTPTEVVAGVEVRSDWWRSRS